MEEGVLRGLQALTGCLCLFCCSEKLGWTPVLSVASQSPLKKQPPPHALAQPCWPPRLTWAGSPLTCSMKQVGVGARA